MTREEAIERLNIHKSTSVFVDSIAEAIDMAIEALSVANLKAEFESADLVRCKDCIHQVKEKGLTWCRHDDGLCGDANDNDYCVHGERSE